MVKKKNKNKKTEQNKTKQNKNKSKKKIKKNNETHKKYNKMWTENQKKN